MTQTDLDCAKNHFLHLSLLVFISLRIPWEWAVQDLSPGVSGRDQHDRSARRGAAHRRDQSDAGGTGWAIGWTLEPGIDHTLPAGAAKFEDG